MTGKIICLRCRRKQGSHLRPRPPASAPILSPEEAHVLCLVASGETSRDIARALSVSDGAVRQHVKSLLYKARALTTSPRAVSSYGSVESQRRS
ncbi:LuxR C-terminal-related transcriptional regulator [Microvirga lotononidis]|uniref:LuxR C-terminal-related transcriptional regulator n=1 Tax=Microvirga lotononidis TaxID=864069 RepID=UPI000A03A4D9